MKNISEIKLIEGQKRKSGVYLHPITVGDIRAVFFPFDDYEKYKYLGISYNIFRVNTEEALALQDFYRKVDKIVKPWYIPRFFLRLLELFGNDNSIVRVRDWYLYRLHNKLTGGNRITDVKTKYGTLRVYGSFNEEIQKELTKLENFINPRLEEY